MEGGMVPSSARQPMVQIVSNSIPLLARTDSKVSKFGSKTGTYLSFRSVSHTLLQEQKDTHAALEERPKIQHSSIVANQPFTHHIRRSFSSHFKIPSLSLRPSLENRSRIIWAHSIRTSSPRKGVVSSPGLGAVIRVHAHGAFNRALPTVRLLEF